MLHLLSVLLLSLKPLFILITDLTVNDLCSHKFEVPSTRTRTLEKPSWISWWRQLWEVSVYIPIGRLKLHLKTWVSAVVLQQWSRARSLEIVHCSVLRTGENVMLRSEATLVGVCHLRDQCQRHTVYFCLEDTVPYAVSFAFLHR